MTYAAYLRVYEPVSAFHEPERSRWAAYAGSAGRSAECDALAAEHAEALRRAIAAPWTAAPERESRHAHVRRADGITYVCPWQVRLCSLPDCPPASGQLPAAGDGTSGRNGGTGPKGRHGTAARPHIQGSAWTVPLAWFVLFAASERWLALGPRGHRTSGTATAAATRALRYTTAMSRARRRAARGLAALRDVPVDHEAVACDVIRAEAELAGVGRWLEEFHPYSLVELDYGGLVQLISDDALSGDQSVAEIGAALAGLAKGQCELAIAMYKRAHSRWRAFAELELAN
jgi:hypothetical protein